MEKPDVRSSGWWKLPLLMAACAAAVLMMIWALLTTGETPDSGFVPPTFEESAVQGTPEVRESLGYSTLDAQAYQVGVCGQPIVEDGSAVLYLTNPAGNTVWLKVRILDENGSVLGESGLLKPGEYVKAVALTETPDADIPVTLKIMAYEPDTYHSAGAASLNTTLCVE